MAPSIPLPQNLELVLADVAVWQSPPDQLRNVATLMSSQKHLYVLFTHGGHFSTDVSRNRDVVVVVSHDRSDVRTRASLFFAETPLFSIPHSFSLPNVYRAV